MANEHEPVNEGLPLGLGSGRGKLYLGEVDEWTQKELEKLRLETKLEQRPVTDSDTRSPTEGE